MELAALVFGMESLRLYEALALILWTVSLLAANRQLKIAQRSRRQAMIVQQVEAYMRMTTSVTDDEVNTMKLHIADHFDPKTYWEHYDNDEKRIKSYLLMKKKYVYLFLIFSYTEDKKSDPGRQAVEDWIKELCKYQEFKHVHQRQGIYYNDFVKYIAELNGGPPSGTIWAVDPWDNQAKKASAT